MNYLAHVFLSRDTPAAVTGAMLGDFVKGQVPEHWGPEVDAAIQLHRAIDRYTDQHPAVLACRTLVSPTRRRFAGIMIDVFFDHFLARDWARYHPQPLREFTQAIYAVLLPQRAVFPPRFQRILPAMVRDDWLSAYRDLSAVNAALNGISRRFRYPERALALRDAVVELERNYTSLGAYFGEFFPQLQAFVAAEARNARGVLST
ncbi:MAG: ACP phosphodiesterase [Sulfurifustis sp.]